MKPWTKPCRRSTISRRRVRGRGGFRRSSIPGMPEIRRVDQNGYVSWRTPLFVSVALADQPVAFEEVDDGIWTVSFASMVLGRFDERQHQIHPIAAITAGRSASSAGSAPHRKNEERR